MTKLPKISVFTLGCKVNQYDSDAMLAVFKSAGFEIAEGLEFAHSLGLEAQIYVGKAVTYEHISPRIQRYLDYHDLPGSEVPDIRQRRWEGIPKVIVYSPRGELEHYVDVFSGHFGNRLKVSASIPDFVELNSVHSGKGIALKTVADSFGVDMSQTVAAGDSPLDIDMLKAAGLAAAVENAHDSVKAVADIIIPHCNEDAVAWLADNVLLNG